MALSAQDARLNGRVGGLTYAATTPHHELSARARRAFEARMARLEALADPDGTLPAPVRRKRAERLLRLEMTKLSHRAVRRRRSRTVMDLAEPLPGDFRSGERNPNARHPDATVQHARELYAKGWNLRRIADAVGADHGTVGRWCRGETRRRATVR